MLFNILTVRAFEQDYPDGRLYPRLSGEESQIIAPEPADGSDVRGFDSASVAVYELGARTPRRLVSTPPNDLLNKHHSVVQVTDSRVTIACQNFTKGSTWIGGGIGTAVAVGAMAVSAAKAKRRRKGKVMVGHVRYEWPTRVGASLPNRYGMNAYVILEYRNGTVAKAVHINCNGIEPSMVAQDIARRAATYRLAHHPELAAEQRSALEGLLHAEKLIPTGKQKAYYELPGSLVVQSAPMNTQR